MRISIKRGITTLGLFTFLAMLPMSCGLLCRDTCGCGPTPKTSEFEIQSFDSKTKDGSGREISASESRPYDQIYKVLEINDVEFTSAVKDEEQNTGSLGIAFACSPAPPISKNDLQLIEILNETEFSLADGTEYGVGENLVSLFGINRYFSSELESIEEFIGTGRKLNYGDDLYFGLLENPEKDLQLEFTIRLVFNDAQEFLFTDQILNVQ